MFGWFKNTMSAHWPFVFSGALVAANLLKVCQVQTIRLQSTQVRVRTQKSKWSSSPVSKIKSGLSPAYIGLEVQTFKSGAHHCPSCGQTHNNGSCTSSLFAPFRSNSTQKGETIRLTCSASKPFCTSFEFEPNQWMASVDIRKLQISRLPAHQLQELLCYILWRKIWIS